MKDVDVGHFYSTSVNDNSPDEIVRIVGSVPDDTFEYMCGLRYYDHEGRFYRETKTGFQSVDGRIDLHPFVGSAKSAVDIVKDLEKYFVSTDELKTELYKDVPQKFAPTYFGNMLKYGEEYHIPFEFKGYSLYVTRIGFIVETGKVVKDDLWGDTVEAKIWVCQDSSKWMDAKFSLQGKIVHESIPDSIPSVYDIHYEVLSPPSVSESEAQSGSSRKFTLTFEGDITDDQVKSIVAGLSSKFSIEK